MLKALKAVGLGAILLGGAALVQGDPTRFGIWATLVYAGIGVLTAELLYEHWRNRWMRYGVPVVFGSVALGFTWIFIWVDAPLGINVTVSEANYPKGTDVGGIKWEPFLSEVRITVTNKSPRDYENLDLSFLVPDLMVVRFGQTVGPIVQFVEENPVLGATFHGKKSDGTKVDTPMESVGNINSTYHARCDRLPRFGTIQIVIALGNSLTTIGSSGQADFPKKLDGPLAELSTLFGPKKIADRE
jgi:hypothetical protein